MIDVGAIRQEHIGKGAPVGVPASISHVDASWTIPRPYIARRFGIHLTRKLYPILNIDLAVA